MSLVPSLLQAIVQVDGEALVMHAGDKPYVVAPAGQIELASSALALDAVSGIVAQLLPAEFQQALDEFGAVQYELAPQPDFPRERFTVVVARGGDDVWAEIRRRHVLDEGFFDVQACNDTNRVDIFVFANDQQALLMARLDNLGKGASGAAVQSMNVHLGLDETMGL